MVASTALALEDACSIGVAYGLSVVRVEPVHGGRVNSNFRLWSTAGETFFLRVYEQQDAFGVRQELELVSELERAGLPTPLPLARADGGWISEHLGKPVAVFPWVDGGWVCQRSVTPELCRELGAGLARLHRASVSCRAPQGRFEADDLRRRLDSVPASHRPELIRAAALVRHKFEAYTMAREAALPSGIIHGDLFRENVLWKAGRVVAMLDFECACHGLFAYDLMVCVLAWCYGASFEWPLVRGMLEGYAAHRRLSMQEIGALPIEAALGCLRFATTRIVDFSMCAGPEGPRRDYRRFLQRLAELEAGASRKLIDIAEQTRRASEQLVAQ